ESGAQALGLLVPEPLFRDGLGAVLVGGDRERRHKARLALVRSVIGDLAEARAGKLRLELLGREAEIFRGLAEEVAHDFLGARWLGRRSSRRRQDLVFLLLRDDALLNETVEKALELVDLLLAGDGGRD